MTEFESQQYLLREYPQEKSMYRLSIYVSEFSHNIMIQQLMALAIKHRRPAEQAED